MQTGCALPNRGLAFIKDGGGWGVILKFGKFSTVSSSHL